MLKRLALLATLVMLFLAAAPAFAAGTPKDVFVDLNKTSGTEDGTKANPYNTIEEATAFAQALPNGGWIYVKQADGSWKYHSRVDSVWAGQTGEPLPAVLVYTFLAVFALALMLVGWKFQKRARQIPA
ncbi:MAG: hypothetical protein EHM81_01595 [Chloroflexi bacterium]|nr:MAG: hypothetical protein EHM81_01595 [Chloroflexota bacterium]